MLRLRVRVLAEAKDLDDAKAFADALGLPLTSARRLWYSSSDASEGGRLKHIDLDMLERLADFFQVEIGELFERVPDTTDATNTRSQTSASDRPQKA